MEKHQPPTTMAGHVLSHVTRLLHIVVVHDVGNNSVMCYTMKILIVFAHLSFRTQESSTAVSEETCRA